MEQMEGLVQGSMVTLILIDASNGTVHTFAQTHTHMYMYMCMLDSLVVSCKMVR